MSIYSDLRKPYFYIIQHRKSGKKYGGAKWGKDADPSNFMTEDGYQTSSPTVWKLIESDGLDAFDVLEIVLEEELQIPFNNYRKVDEYEAWFLREHSCGTSMDWLNRVQHASYGSDEFYENMIASYGVQHAMQSPEIVERHKSSILNSYGVDNVFKLDWVQDKVDISMIERYGVRYPMQNVDLKNKIISTNNNRYGVDWPLQNLNIQEKSKKTLLEKTGYEFAILNPETQEKTKKTLFERTGYEYTWLNPEVVAKSKQTNMKNLGVEYALSSPIVIEKRKQTLLLNHGVDNVFKLDSVKQKIKQTQKENALNKYGVDHVGKVGWRCFDCDIDGKGLRNLTTHHGTHSNKLLIRGEYVEYKKC
jgi:hypothetical protein